MRIGPGIGSRFLGIGRRRGRAPQPSNLSVAWIDDFARLSWDTDKDGQFEIWEERSGGAYVQVATTTHGATSYDNYTWQNASMKFKVIGVGSGAEFSNEVSITTPLVWVYKNKAASFQARLVRMYVASGYAVNVAWGDGGNTPLSGNNTDVYYTYVNAGTHYAKLTGDVNFITDFRVYHDVTGDISKWVFPGQNLESISLANCTIVMFSARYYGDISNVVLPQNLISLNVSQTDIHGKLPDKLAATRAGGLAIDVERSFITGSNLTSFRTGMTSFKIDRMYDEWDADEVNKLFKNMADWFETHAPTANCTVTVTGLLAASPTGGQDNPDIVRLKSYWVAAGRTFTAVINEPVPFDNGKLVLTVDGNVPSLYTVTFPFLINKSVPCTYYTCSDYGQDWFEEPSKAKEMYDAGMDMQCHSATHRRLTDLTEQQLEEEEMQPVNSAFLNAGMPTPVHHAYPWGSSNEAVRDIISQYRLTGRTYQENPLHHWPFYKNVNKFLIPGGQIDESVISNSDNMTLIKARMSLAQANNAAISLMWHSNTVEGLALLEEIIDHAIDIGMDIIDMYELHTLLEGVHKVTFTVDDGADPIEGARIEIDNHVLFTDASGEAVIHLEDGSYSYEVTKDGFTPEDDTFDVDGDDLPIPVTLTEI